MDKKMQKDWTRRAGDEPPSSGEGDPKRPSKESFEDIVQRKINEEGKKVTDSGGGIGVGAPVGGGAAPTAKIRAFNDRIARKMQEDSARRADGRGSEEMHASLDEPPRSGGGDPKRPARKSFEDLIQRKINEGAKKEAVGPDNGIGVGAPRRAASDPAAIIPAFNDRIDRNVQDDLRRRASDGGPKEPRSALNEPPSSGGGDSKRPARKSFEDIIQMKIDEAAKKEAADPNKSIDVSALRGGDPKRPARKSFEDLIQRNIKEGVKEEAAVPDKSIAVSVLRVGDPKRSVRKSFEDLIQMKIDSGAKKEVADPDKNTGVNALRGGDPNQPARKSFEDIIQMKIDSGAKKEVAEPEKSIGVNALRGGDPKRPARKSFEDIIQMKIDSGAKKEVADPDKSTGVSALRGGDPKRPARKHFEDLIQRKINEGAKKEAADPDKSIDDSALRGDDPKRLARKSFEDLFQRKINEGAKKEAADPDKSIDVSALRGGDPKRPARKSFEDIIQRKINKGVNGLVELYPEPPPPVPLHMMADGDDDIEGGEKQRGASRLVELVPDSHQSLSLQTVADGDDAIEEGEKQRGANRLVELDPDSPPPLPPQMSANRDDAIKEVEKQRGANRLVEIDPDSPPPLPPQMVAGGDDTIEGGEKLRAIRLLELEPDSSLPPPPTMMADEEGGEKLRGAIGLVELEPHAPFNIANAIENEDDVKQNTAVDCRNNEEPRSPPTSRDLRCGTPLADDRARPAMANNPEEGAPTERTIVSPPYVSGAEETQRVQGGQHENAVLVGDSGDDHASDSDGSGIYIPGAFLVEDEDIPLYDGVPIPDELPPVWWKSRRFAFALVATLSVAVIAGAVAGSVVASGGSDGNDGALLTNLGQLVPTLSPTLSPPPLNCSILDLGPFFEEENPSECIDMMTRAEGGSIAIYRFEDYACEAVRIQLLSPFDGANGTFEASMPHSFEHGIDEDLGEIALSESSLFTTFPFPTDIYESGVVLVSPRDSSGGILDEIERLVPGDVGADAEFGASIAVDGDLLLVGAPNDAAGSAFVYRRLGSGSWSEEAKLVPPDDSNSQKFGSSVSVKDNLAVVAAKGDVGVDGMIHFYHFDPLSSSWERLENSTLTNEDCDGEFGSSLALTVDYGLFVGCPMVNDFQGAVYYYQRSSEGEIYNLLQKITGRKSQERFGASDSRMAVKSNGDIIAIGGWDKLSELDNNVYVFANFDNVWREVARIESPEADSIYFGLSITISQDRLMIASWENTYSYELTCADQEPPDYNISRM